VSRLISPDSQSNFAIADTGTLALCAKREPCCSGQKFASRRSFTLPGYNRQLALLRSGCDVFERSEDVSSHSRG
jgi:hypothetical protein